MPPSFFVRVTLFLLVRGSSSFDTRPTFQSHGSSINTGRILAVAVNSRTAVLNSRPSLVVRAMAPKKEKDEGEQTVTILQRIIRLRGPVDTGYGRGGKKLGFPTANLPSSTFNDALENVPTGVYFGWAVVEDDTGKIAGRNEEVRAVVNVGYSPTFENEENKEKIVEAHLMLEEDDEQLDDFYGENMRLALSGFLRPEQKFPSFPELVAAINNDVVSAKASLMMQPFAGLRIDPFIVDPCPDTEGNVWIGQDGGDGKASWEFQDMKDAIAAATF